MRDHDSYTNHRHGRHGHHGRHDHHGGNWADLAEALEHSSRLLSHCLGDRRGQSRILRILSEQNQMTQKDLQDQLHIQAASMSEIAVKLESKGLIVRNRDDADKRKIVLSITAQGREQASQQNDPAIRQHRAELFSGLSQGEQDTLRELLDKLSADWTKRLERERAGTPE